MIGRATGGVALVKLINTHCHLLNAEFISPTCFKSRSACLEWMLRHEHTRPLLRLVAASIPQRMYPERMARFLKKHGRSVSDLPKWLLANLDVTAARV